MSRKVLLQAFAVALTAASVAGGTMWLVKNPRDQIVITPGGGCESPPPGQGCDPSPDETEPRGHTLWLFAAFATGTGAFSLAYVALSRRARRLSNPPVPPARVV